MIRLTQLRGQRVLTREGGQQLGSIRRLRLDAGEGAVVAAELEGGTGEGTILDWSAVSSIGPDAVMVESESSVRDARSEIEQRFTKGDFDLPGKMVVDEGGDSLGSLEDIEFDEASGRLAAIHVPGHAVAIDRVVAVGPDAVIIPRPR